MLFSIWHIFKAKHEKNDLLILSWFTPPKIIGEILNVCLNSSSVIVSMHFQIIIIIIIIKNAHRLENDVVKIQISWSWVYTSCLYMVPFPEYLILENSNRCSMCECQYTVRAVLFNHGVSWWERSSVLHPCSVKSGLWWRIRCWHQGGSG